MAEPKDRPATDDDDHHPDTASTQQKDNPVPGRQRFRSARPPGDTSSDFGGDGAISHPVKSDDDTDESKES